MFRIIGKEIYFDGWKIAILEDGIPPSVVERFIKIVDQIEVVGSAKMNGVEERAQRFVEGL
jgi:hypothetical protein